MKYERHSKILQLVQENNIETQEELTKLLCESDFDVTQATISRDIKELGLIKVAGENGNSRYSSSQHHITVAERHLTILENVVLSVDYAMHTIVIKTPEGMAQAAGVAIDSLMGNDMLGCIGGDDTLMIITKSEDHAKELISKIKKILKIGKN